MNNPATRTAASLKDLPTAAAGGVPAWMQKMRQAAVDKISEDDIAEIVKAHVERAKKGDLSSTRFIFEQVLGGAAFKGATITQNVTEHHYHEHAAEETPVEPGSKADRARRVRKMAERNAQGLPLRDPADNIKPDLS